MAASSSSLAGDPPTAPGTRPVFELVDTKRVFFDPGHRIEVYDIGPSPHAEEMLVLYVPKEKMLFEADLLNAPRSGQAAPANDTTVHFADAIRSLGLEVETIVGIHGGIGTIADSADALRRRGDS